MSVTTTSVYEGFQAWNDAAPKTPAKKELRARLVGRRVRMISRVTPDVDGPVGVIVSVGLTGVRVKWSHSGEVEYAHPDDLRFF